MPQVYLRVQIITSLIHPCRSANLICCRLFIFAIVIKQAGGSQNAFWLSDPSNPASLNRSAFLSSMRYSLFITLCSYRHKRILEFLKLKVNSDRHQGEYGGEMAVYKRGKTYYYEFQFNGARIQ
jgi:hypothetical protein